MGWVGVGGVGHLSVLVPVWAPQENGLDPLPLVSQILSESLVLSVTDGVRIFRE